MPAVPHPPSSTLRSRALLAAAALTVLSLSAVTAMARVPAVPSAEPPAAETPAAALPGLRVLIDVSGSMVQNDPDNLRVAGLRLLTGLLPPELEVGVWLFGAKTEGLLRAAPVTDAWKDKARLLAARIHSRAAFTHIELALQTAAADWLQTPAEAPRDILLLTDGVVDVAKDPAVSAASRQRIESELLPALIKSGVAIHSIALSAAADRELLETLARASGGQMLAVTEAAELDRAFLELLEGSHPRDGLPLTGTELKVDASVRELTLLAFHSEGQPRLSLRTPEGDTLEPPELPKGVRWLREPGYDLVTVRAPTPGTWFMHAPPDPDNRALVVSDLAVHLDELPSELRAGGNLAVTATLTERGEAIVHRDFLNLVTLSASLEQDRQALQTTALRRHADSADFQGELATTDLDGEFELKLRVDGKTFVRERRSRIRVLPQPVKVELGGLASDDPEFLLYVEPTGEAPRELEVIARWQAGDDQGQQQRFQAVEGPVVVKLRKHAPEILKVELEAHGQDAHGRAFEQTLGPYWLEALPGTEPPDAPRPDTTGVRWLRVAWQVGAVNALIAGLAVLAWFIWQGRAAHQLARHQGRLARA